MTQGWLNERYLTFDGTSSPLKAVLFLFICLAWVLPGLTGHTPWKYDEAVSQGIIHGIVQGGSWLSPTLTGEPYLVHPPLYYWLGAALIRISFGLIPHHDAARLATGVCMLATFWCLSLAAHHLYGSRTRRLSVLILMGSIGLIIRAHEMSTDIAWLTGCTALLAALPIGRTLSIRGGLMAGIGLGVAFLSQGMISFPLLLPILTLTPALIAEFRPPKPLHFLLAFVLGLLPFLLIWPALLITLSPSAWALWKPLLLDPLIHPSLWWVHDATPWYPWVVSGWFAWPAAPLALGALWSGGQPLWQRPQTRFLILTIICWAIVLGFGTPAREGNVLPLLLPFSLLAAGTMDSLRRGAASALDWFGMLTFGLITLLLWLGWIAQMTGWPSGIVRYLDAQLPDFHPHFQVVPFLFSLLLTLLWGLTIAHSHPSPRRALMNWTVGMTVSWLLTMSLWLPYVEASRSYEGVMISLRHALPAHQGCLMSTGLNEPQRGLLYYDLDLVTERKELDPMLDCPLWLIRFNAQTPFLIPTGWHLRWSGSRLGDRDERFILLSHVRR